MRKRRRSDQDSLLQVPIDVAVHEPWTGVVSLEPDRNIIIRAAEAYNVAYDGVYIVVLRGACAADDVEVMPMQVDGVLIKKCRSTAISILGTVVVDCKLTGPPVLRPPAPFGKNISTLWLIPRG
jgi:hypothetical protein